MIVVAWWDACTSGYDVMDGQESHACGDLTGTVSLSDRYVSVWIIYCGY